MSGLEGELNRVVRHFTHLATHGPDLRITAHKKLVQEAVEFKDKPSLEEAADVLICLAVAVDFQGWSQAQLVKALRDKMVVNRKRIWTLQEDGTWQHDER